MTKHNEKHQCEHVTWKGYYGYQCPNPAKVCRNGKYYCGIHDPEKVKERADKRRAKSMKKFDERNHERKLTEARKNFCAGLDIEFMETHTINDYPIGPRRYDEPPKDGTVILASWGGDPVIVYWFSCEGAWCDVCSEKWFTACDPDWWAEITVGKEETE